jgi:hypothetical protein
LIVDSDRIAILPGASATRPPLSVAWVRDIVAYAVDHVDPNVDGKKRSRFGRRKDDKDAVVRLSRLVLTVPGGQISITATSQPDVLLAQLDQFLQPRISGQVPPVASEAEYVSPQPTVDAAADTSRAETPVAGVPLSETAVPETAVPEAAVPQTAVPETAVPEAAVPQTAVPGAPVPGPATPEPVVGASEPTIPEAAAPEAPQAAAAEPTAEVAAPEAADATAPETAEESAPGAAAPAHDAGSPATSHVEMPNLEPDTPEAVYESIRKLAELAVLGTISSEEFATKKAQLLARL